jgi:hypothetical protein
MNSNILHKGEVMKLVNEVLETYSNNDWYETVLKKEKILFLYDVGFNLRRNGRYIRSNKPVYNYKKFRQTIKRDWSFKCGWCNKRISSKKDKGYFSIARFEWMQTHSDNFVRTCSESCSKLLWDDLFKSWLKESGLWIDEIIEMAGYK